MKYIATVSIVDMDYRSYAGSEDVEVDSWEDAETYCKDQSWSGEYYKVDFLRNKTTGKVYRNEKAMEEEG